MDVASGQRYEGPAAPPCLVPGLVSRETSSAQISRSYVLRENLSAHPGPEVERPSMVEFVLVRAPRAGH
jgi:hypothetical protein